VPKFTNLVAFISSSSQVANARASGAQELELQSNVRANSRTRSEPASATKSARSSEANTEKTRFSELLTGIVPSFLHAGYKGTANATMRSFRKSLQLTNVSGVNELVSANEKSVGSVGGVGDSVI
jgi:hypothetical protein